MSAFLGIDVGGTASRWSAIDGSGALLARGAAPGATGHLFAAPERLRFEAMADEIAAAFSTRPVAAIHAGITGLGPQAYADARAILGAVIGAAAVTVSDDMQLAFLAVFAPGAGHLVSAGTGSIGLHIAADGTSIRVGGRGILVDDGGSGSWIALTALDRLFRLVDETGGTPGAEKLADAVYAAVGGRSWDHVRSFVYGGDRGRIGTLARAVATAAAAGDVMARDILDEAIHELARLAKALIGRAGILPVGFIGGVLDLDPSIRPGLMAALPEVDVHFPTPDAALRAAELARRGWNDPPPSPAP